MILTFSSWRMTASRLTRHQLLFGIHRSSQVNKRNKHTACCVCENKAELPANSITLTMGVTELFSHTVLVT